MGQGWIALLLTVISGYLLGSVNSAIVVARLFGLPDIRRYGSGNAGATNMFRTHGKKPAALTFLGDLLKAVFAVLLARAIFHLFASPIIVDPGYVSGLFVLLGHIFPVYFGFKGGKGVMPAFGIILLVNPPVFLILFAVALPVFLISRTMSLVSVLSAILYPIATMAVCLIRHTNPWYETGFALAYSILVLYSHRSNIKRLLGGTEKPVLPGKPRPGS